jgi:rhodanese-related sulfurtransferase
MNDHRVPRRLINETLFILLASVVLALVVNSLRPGGIRFFGPAEPTAKEDAAGSEAADGPVEIPLDAALAAHEAGDTLFADARPYADYEAGHIAGARHLPVNRFDEWIDGFIENHPPDTPIITYCDGPHCPLAESLAEQLYFAGYNDVRYLHNGWSRWREAGGADDYGP